jgi:hypothetical protein
LPVGYDASIGSIDDPVHNASILTLLSVMRCLISAMRCSTCTGFRQYRLSRLPPYSITFNIFATASPVTSPIASLFSFRIMLPVFLPVISLAYFSIILHVSLSVTSLISFNIMLPISLPVVSIVSLRITSPVSLPAASLTLDDSLLRIFWHNC